VQGHTDNVNLNITFCFTKRKTSNTLSIINHLKAMNPKYRLIYLVLGFAGLIYLIYHVASTISDGDGINPGAILIISIPDLVLFFLAYKTYPIESEVKRSR
jgi:hypothetical protein